MDVHDIPTREQWRRDLGPFSTMNHQQRDEAGERINGPLSTLLQRMRRVDPNIGHDHLTPEMRQHPVAYSQRLGPMGGGGQYYSHTGSLAHIAPWPGTTSELPDGCMLEDIRAWHLLHGTDTVVTQTMGGAVFSFERRSSEDYWLTESEVIDLLDDWSIVLSNVFVSEKIKTLHETENDDRYSGDRSRWIRAERRYGYRNNALIRRFWLLGVDSEGRFRLMGEKIPLYLRQGIVEADRRVGLSLGVIPMDEDLDYRDGI
jgi:hypothetical protein